MKKNIFAACSLALLLSACGSTNTANDTSTSNAMNTTNTVNALTPAEQQAGWTLLFDGKSLNGWRPYQNKQSHSWTVSEGTLYCKGSASDKSDLRADIITVDQFENFDFSIDWKIAPKSNSGIMYLVTEEYPAAYLSGPEYQIIDDAGYPAKLEDWQKTGANYAMNPAPEARTNPIGEWNNTRIVVNKGKVEHWLNGKMIVSYEMWTDKWQQEKVTGKWKDAPGYGVAKKGHIALQDHGDQAWFRNIKIRKL